MDDEHTEFLEELKMEMLEEQRREEEEMERAARAEEEQVGCGILLNVYNYTWMVMVGRVCVFFLCIYLLCMAFG